MGRLDNSEQSTKKLQKHQILTHFGRDRQKLTPCQCVNPYTAFLCRKQALRSKNARTFSQGKLAPFFLGRKHFFYVNIRDFCKPGKVSWITLRLNRSEKSSSKNHGCFGATAQTVSGSPRFSILWNTYIHCR